MAYYFVKTPWWLKKLYPSRLLWSMPQEARPAVYLTFDDGPHPTATPYTLEQLDRYDAAATFFCIGKNVLEEPLLFDRLRNSRHSIGNHTQNHLNGWKTNTGLYIDNIHQAAEHIDSRLFRPPYGRIKHSQIKILSESQPSWKICMWDVLSADFDTRITPQKCLENVVFNIEPGSIVVFHDSAKAFDRMAYALPRVLEHCRKMKWAVKALPQP